MRKWPSLKQQYGGALAELTSLDAWKKTFEEQHPEGREMRDNTRELVPPGLGGGFPDFASPVFC